MTPKWVWSWPPTWAPPTTTSLPPIWLGNPGPPQWRRGDRRRPGSVLDEVLRHFDEVLATSGGPQRCSRCWYRSPGTGRVLHRHCGPAAHHARLGRLRGPSDIGTSFDTAVVVDNDVNVMALGDHRTRSPRTESVVHQDPDGHRLWIVSHGELHRGLDGAAGDIGHTRLPDHDTTVCACANTGRLEAVASGAAIARQLRRPGSRRLPDFRCGPLGTKRRPRRHAPRPKGWRAHWQRHRDARQLLQPRGDHHWRIAGCAQ